MRDDASPPAQTGAIRRYLVPFYLGTLQLGRSPLACTDHTVQSASKVSEV